MRNRLIQLIGGAVLFALTLALLLAFRAQLLPYQEDGDAFGTVYAVQSDSESEPETESFDASEIE